MWRIICLASVFGSFLQTSNAVSCDLTIINTCAGKSEVYGPMLEEIKNITLKFSDSLQIRIETYDGLKLNYSSVKTLSNGNVEISIKYTGKIKVYITFSSTELTFHGGIVIKITFNVGDNDTCASVSFTVSGEFVPDNTPFQTTFDPVTLNEFILAGLTSLVTPVYETHYTPLFCGCLKDEGACK